jgi:Short C-terminal domain
VLNPLTHRRILKKGVPGRAMIISMGGIDRGATSFNLPMTLQVYVEGWTPYEVEDQWMVKAKDTIALSGAIPVRVDPDDQTRVAIDWDGVRARHEQEETARRQALAAQGPVTDLSAVGGLAGLGELATELAAAAQMSAVEPQGVTPVIDLRGDPDLRRKLEAVLGRELTPGSTETIASGDPQLQMQVMQVVQEHMAQQAFTPPAPATGDPTARLKQLADLRDAGLITSDEFEAKKAEILREL